MSELERATVQRVRDALLAANHDDTIIDLGEAARTAEQAAKAVNFPLGAIVKSLVFTIDNRFVMALVAGDHKCIEENLSKALNIRGKVRRPQAAEVKAVTGFSIGGVAPIGFSQNNMPMVIDASLKRFASVFAAAGHPNCVFKIEFSALARLTGAIISHNIAAPMEGAEGYVPSFKRSKTLANDDI